MILLRTNYTQYGSEEWEVDHFIGYGCGNGLIDGTGPSRVVKHDRPGNGLLNGDGPLYFTEDIKFEHIVTNAAVTITYKRI